MAPNKHNSEQTILQQYSTAIVVGLGITGYSVVRYLSLRGFKVTVLDTRSSPPLASKLKKHYPDVECCFGDIQTSVLESVELVIVSPGVSLKQPIMVDLKKMGAYIVGDIELFIEDIT